MLPEGKEVRALRPAPLFSSSWGTRGPHFYLPEPFIIYYRRPHLQQGYGEPKYDSSDKGLKLLSQQHSTRWKTREFALYDSMNTGQAGAWEGWGPAEDSILGGAEPSLLRSGLSRF